MQAVETWQPVANQILTTRCGSFRAAVVSVRSDVVDLEALSGPAAGTAFMQSVRELREMVRIEQLVVEA